MSLSWWRGTAGQDSPQCGDDAQTAQSSGAAGQSGGGAGDGAAWAWPWAAAGPSSSAADPGAGAQERWWGWWATPAVAVAEAEDDELLRAAKAAVDGAKDQCHYAVRARLGAAEVEVAVANTPTAAQPVRCAPQRRPAAPFEAQERAMAAGGASAGAGAGGASAGGAGAGGAGGAAPTLDANLRHITARTWLRLHAEAAVHGARTSERHLYRTAPARVRRAVVVAIHTFVPPKLVKVLVGHGTGTAEQMAQRAAAAVARQLGRGCVVDSVALDGQGTHAQRVEASLALLDNWAREVAAADFVYVVTSGAAVAAACEVVCAMAARHQLAHAHVGFLVVAGAVHGPAAERDAAVVLRAYTPPENDAIGELFELQRAGAPASVRLARQVRQLCRHNVKFTMAAALGDQWVPLGLALANTWRHPNIFRVVWDDGAVPLFVARLVAVAVTMENVGRGDLNLVAALAPLLLLAKALGAHASVLAADAVYDVGVRFALDTTSLVYRRDVAHVAPPADPSLFHMPWNLRGLVHELLHVRNVENLRLLRELVAEYRAWEPTSAKWRELKSCFAAFDDLDVDDLLV